MTAVKTAAAMRMFAMTAVFLKSCVGKGGCERNFQSRSEGRRKK
jgi:hypothetical protein